MLERVQAAGRAIVTASIEAGGVLSGEHGIGLEKRDYMGMLFSAHDMATQDLVREALDPDGFANPLQGFAIWLPLQRLVRTTCA